MGGHPPISNDVIDLGPGLFASADWRVINRNGENFYLSCGAVVYEHPGGEVSHCIKPLYHRQWDHEDFDGRTRYESFAAQSLDEKLRIETVKILRRTGIEEHEVFNVLNALLYAGIKLTKES